MSFVDNDVKYNKILKYNLKFISRIIKIHQYKNIKVFSYSLSHVQYIIYLSFTLNFHSRFAMSQLIADNIRCMHIYVSGNLEVVSYEIIIKIIIKTDF